MTLLTISFSVRPSSLARSRSMSSCKRGIIDVLRHQHVADARQRADLSRNLRRGLVGLLADSMPLTWMSIGAGMPRLSTASTSPPVWKYAVICGRSCRTAPHAVHVFVAAEAVSFLQTHLHEGGVLAELLV